MTFAPAGLDVRADGLYLPAFDDDCLVGRGRARLRVYEPPGFDDRDLRARARKVLQQSASSMTKTASRVRAGFNLMS
jgi:hypothetical protein